ncbi:hypothetical protein H2248_001768 [Termitomyces sp. 'cryptogamus']|nr:hypothetical protein H2248_001768 [Termitomyces sp. 'cryptogamus']
MDAWNALRQAESAPERGRIGSAQNKIGKIDVEKSWQYPEVVLVIGQATPVPELEIPQTPLPWSAVEADERSRPIIEPVTRWCRADPRHCYKLVCTVVFYVIRGGYARIGIVLEPS